MSTSFRIKELRNAAGLTQAEVATRLGLKSASTVGMWESGDRNPPSKKLPELAEALNTTVGELFKKDESTTGGE